MLSFPPPLPDQPDPEIEALIAQAGAQTWARTVLAADASPRRYLRLTAGDRRTLILMDARRDTPSLDAFARVGAHLRNHGFEAPAIHHRDGGLAILEDLGPTLLSDLADGSPHGYEDGLAAVVDALADLADVPVLPGLAVHDRDRAIDLLGPLHDAAPDLLPGGAAHAEGSARALDGALSEAMGRHGGEPDTLSLRDVHAGNIVWRDGAEGRDRVGLLDFQDAHRAPLAYDLASLLYDARRRIDDDLRRRLVQRFAQRRGRDPDALALAAAVHAVQRNLRILGLFTGFGRQGRTAYLAHLPTVRRQLHAALTDRRLSGLRHAAEPWLAAP